MTKAKAMQEILAELENANDLFPLFTSAHEGYAVIKEEVDELWDSIKTRDTIENQRAEAIQIGAMAIKFLISIPR